MNIILIFEIAYVAAVALLLVLIAVISITYIPERQINRQIADPEKDLEDALPRVEIDRERATSLVYA